MIRTNELLEKIVSLPIDLRAMFVNELLKSLNPTSKEIDELWAMEAERRVEEINTQKVQTIPGEQVFERIRTSRRFRIF